MSDFVKQGTGFIKNGTRGHLLIKAGIVVGSIIGAQLIATTLFKDDSRYLDQAWKDTMAEKKRLAQN
ncbi:hypothetical protein NADFUDRAFT_45109 [Nadsonia fulvescens var. elongata DSM 6958]|uniref:Uncharacterized protein n=1 Tax=Nadsonia fulvescens var. elongata DSM 6958 TaxID=857566 RepID=A0A1E3PT38_9ASCO|nr:hypothetical protein NADFUDRAFT_45109 [Nadsonia fulvescens var. elongata DSM 6958]